MNTIELLEAGVDYLTVTARDQDSRRELRLRFREAVEQASVSAPIYRPFKAMGYVGMQVDGMQYGERDDGAILRISGAHASLFWHKMLPPAERVTRMDVATTVTLGRPDPGYVERCYDALLQASERQDRSRKLRLIVNSEQGATLYIGSRKSTYFGRLYDKGVEAKSAGPGHCYRYEVEIKKPKADSFAEALMSSVQPERDIQGYVYAWFYSRGLKPKFGAGAGNIIMERDMKVIDESKTIEWLTTCVAPVVKRLSGTRWRRDVEEALQMTFPFLVILDQDGLVLNDTEEL